MKIRIKVTKSRPGFPVGETFEAEKADAWMIERPGDIRFYIPADHAEELPALRQPPDGVEMPPEGFEYWGYGAPVTYDCQTSGNLLVWSNLNQQWCATNGTSGRDAYAIMLGCRLHEKNFPQPSPNEIPISTFRQVSEPSPPAEARKPRAFYVTIPKDVELDRFNAIRHAIVYPSEHEPHTTNDLRAKFYVVEDFNSTDDGLRERLEAAVERAEDLGYRLDDATKAADNWKSNWGEMRTAWREAEAQLSALRTNIGTALIEIDQGEHAEAKRILTALLPAPEQKQCTCGNGQWCCSENCVNNRPPEQTPEPIEVEAGKRYMRRDGKISEPIIVRKKYPAQDFFFFDNSSGHFLREDGRCYPGSEHLTDLINEHPEPLGVAVGDGWRLLVVGENILPTDEGWDDGVGPWSKASRAAIGLSWNPTNLQPFRRPVAKAGKYHPALIEIAERLNVTPDTLATAYRSLTPRPEVGP